MRRQAAWRIFVRRDVCLPLNPPLTLPAVPCPTSAGATISNCDFTAQAYTILPAAGHDLEVLSHVTLFQCQSRCCANDQCAGIRVPQNASLDSPDPLDCTLLRATAGAPRTAGQATAVQLLADRFSPDGCANPACQAPQGACKAATCQDGQCALVNATDGTPCDNGYPGLDRCAAGVCTSPFLVTNASLAAFDMLLPGRQHTAVVHGATSPMLLGPAARAQFTTLEAAPAAPPQGIAVYRATETALDLAWRPPPLARRNGALVRYTVTVQYAPSVRSQLSPFQRQLTVNGTRLQLLLADLRGGIPYEVSVAAATAAGQGPAASIISATRPSVPTSAPVILGGEDGPAATLTLVLQLPARESWGGNLTTARVFYQLDPNVDVGAPATPRKDIAVAATLAGNLTAVLTDIPQPFSVYHVRVALGTAAGFGPASAEAMVRSGSATPPVAPSNVALQAISTSMLVASWDAPKFDTGIVAGYALVAASEAYAFDRCNASACEDLGAVECKGPAVCADDGQCVRALLSDGTACRSGAGECIGGACQIDGACVGWGRPGLVWTRRSAFLAVFAPGHLFTPTMSHIRSPSLVLSPPFPSRI